MIGRRERRSLKNRKATEEQVIAYVIQLRKAVVGVDAGINEFPERVGTFSRKLYTKYPDRDVRGTRLYYVLLGSTTYPSPHRFDFPGDDSIVAFHEKLAEEFVPEQFALIKEAYDRECGRSRDA